MLLKVLQSIEASPENRARPARALTPGSGAGIGNGIRGGSRNRSHRRPQMIDIAANPPKFRRGGLRNHNRSFCRRFNCFN
jgi:hypothetical protein